MYVNYDDIGRVSSKRSGVFEIINLIYYHTVLTVKPMGDSMLRINEIDHFIRIMLMTCRENDQFVQLRHFEEKRIETESLNCEDARALTVQHDLRLKIVF